MVRIFFLWPLSVLLCCQAMADGYVVKNYDLLALQSGARKYMIEIRVDSVADDGQSITGEIRRVFVWGSGKQRAESWEPDSKHSFLLRNRTPRVVKGVWGALTLYWNGISAHRNLVGTSVVLLPAPDSDRLFEIAASTPAMDRKLAVFGSAKPRQAVEKYEETPISQLEADLADPDWMILAHATLQRKGAATHELVLRNIPGRFGVSLLRRHFKSLEPWRRPGFFHAVARHMLLSGRNLWSDVQDLGNEVYPAFLIQALDVGTRAYALTALPDATSYVVSVCQRARGVPAEPLLRFLQSLSPPLDKGDDSQTAVDNIFDCLISAMDQHPDTTVQIKDIVRKRLPQWKHLLGSARCDRADQLLGTTLCRP